MGANEWEHTWQHSAQAVVVQCKVKKDGESYQGFVYDQDNDRWLTVNGENNGTDIEGAIAETERFAERLIGEMKRKQTPKTPNPTDAKPIENGKAVGAVAAKEKEFVEPAISLCEEEAESGKVLERLKRLEQVVNGNGRANGNGQAVSARMGELRREAAEALAYTDDGEEIEKIRQRLAGLGIYPYPAYLGPGAKSDAKCWVNWRGLRRFVGKPWKATIQMVVFYDPEKRKKEVAKASRCFSSRLDAYRWLEEQATAIKENNEVLVIK